MTPRIRNTSAFSLVEVTIALGIAAFCLLAIFGLLPTGLNASKAAIQQTTATSIMAAIESDLRTATSNQTQTNIYNLSLSGTGEQKLQFTMGGKAITGTNGDPFYEAAVTAQPSSGTSSRKATQVYLKVTWPAAMTPPERRPGKVEIVTALDRN